MAPAQARVAVIGGGVMGVGVLHHLARNGWSDAVLFEKAELTSGSTWHAAGQVTHATTSRVMGWINRESIRTYLEAEAETGHNVGWHEVGGYRVAYDELEVDWLKAILNVGRLLDFPMELVSGEAILEGNPFYNVEGVKAGLRTFADGHIDPSGATQAMAAAARARGARILRQTRVTGAARRGDEWLLRTEKGDYLVEHVVIAAGSYANQVGRWFGLTIPSVSCLHHYLVTEPVPEFQARDGELPIMRDNSYGGYIRQEQKSGLIGVYESRNAPTIWTEGVPWDIENELFEPNFDGLAHELERAFNRMPVLAERGVKRVVRGAITHTPDGGMLVGPAPGARNLWLACGASIGIAWGGGAGRALADWMVHGSCEISTRALDPRRYGAFASDDYILVKTREDFEIRHDTPTPGQQRPAGRPWIKHALYDRLAAKGAVFGEVAGYERPRWFASQAGASDANGWRRQLWHDTVARETRAVREAAGVIDLTAFTSFEVTGEGAHGLLERLSANRVPARDGRLALCHFLNRSGAFETEMTIARLGRERFFLCSAIGGRIKDRDWLAAHVAPGEDVHIRDLTDEWGMLALSGPASRAILAQGTSAALSNHAFPWLSGQEIEAFGALALALRVSYAGELGWELHAPMADLPAIYDGLFEVGRAHGLADYGGHALNSLRLEKAYRGSAELTPDIGLVEAGMTRFFHPQARAFLGREATLARIERGAEWRLAYLALEADDADAHGGEAVMRDGEVVGLTSSGAYGHSVGQSLAFAYLRADRPDDGLTVQILGGARPARALAEAAYDPDNRKPRGLE